MDKLLHSSAPWHAQQDPTKVLPVVKRLFNCDVINKFR